MREKIQIIEGNGLKNREDAEILIAYIKAAISQKLAYTLFDDKFSLYSIRTAEKLGNILNKDVLLYEYNFYIVVKLLKKLDIEKSALPETYNGDRGVGVIYTFKD